MNKVIPALALVILVSGSVFAKETEKKRSVAGAKSDGEVEIKSFGGSYPGVLRIVDLKYNVVCFATANSNNGTAIACQPLTR